MAEKLIVVTLPDGSQRDVPAGSTVGDVASSIGRRLGKDAVAAVVNGKEVDLATVLEADSEVSIITPATEAGRHVLRHSTAHVLAQAVTRLFPGAKFSIGPAIENGFYYDFDLPGGATFSDDDLARISDEMSAIVAADQPFERVEMSAEDALALFSDQPYKCEIIERVRSADADGLDAGEVDDPNTISAYRNTAEFVDMCVGPHVPSTSRLGHFALQRTSGAYWRGDESRKMLQRIYGTAWESREALDAHLRQLEEAA